MKVKDYIEYTIKCLAYMLDGGADGKRNDMCRFYNKNNFNVGHFGIAKLAHYPFYIREEKRFGGDLSYFDDDDDINGYEIPVYYAFIVRLLFEKEFSKLGLINQFETMQENTQFSIQYELENNISKFISSGLSIDDMKGQLSSYRLIYSLIVNIKSGDDKGILDNNSYNKLIDELNKIVVVNPNSIAAEIKSLSKLSYDDIVCLQNRQPELIAKLQALSGVETHLIEAFKFPLAEREMVSRGLDESAIDALLEDVEFSEVLEMEIDGWQEFCYWVYWKNYESLIFYNKLHTYKPILAKGVVFNISRGTPFGR